MKRGEYLRTRESQANQHRERKIKRFYFNFDAGILRTKSSASGEENARFQKELLQAMAKRRLKPFRGELAVRLNFTISQNDPPMIHKLPKYYLDLLQAPLSELVDACKKQNRNGRRLLIGDDQDINYLSVTYWYQEPEKDQPYCPRSSMSITVEPWRHFLEDLRLLKRIQADDFVESEDRRSRRHTQLDHFFQDDDDAQSEEIFNELLEEFEESTTNPQAYLQRYNGDAAMCSKGKEHCQMRLQEQYLKKMKMSMSNWIGLFSSITDRDRAISGLDQANRVFAFHPYFSLELPGLPTKKQPTGAPKFIQIVEQEIRDRYQKEKILRPLYHPLSISLFLLEPEDKGKDLDNLMLDIAPLVHNIYQPPTLPKVFQEVSGERLLKGTHQTMISSYQALKIPRLRSDSKQGFIQLRFEDGMAIGKDFWAQMDAIIDKWKEAVAR